MRYCPSGILPYALLAGFILGTACGLGCQRSATPSGARVAGDQRSASTLAAVTPTSTTDNRHQTATTPASDSSSTGAKTAPPKKRDEESAPPPGESEAFVAPFPHRSDPFHRPDLHKLAETRGALRDEGSQIRLTGFVNVDGLKALLLVDGNVVSVRPGEECAGVEVIEVAPPRVILQRGRLRWTEDLSTVQ